MSNFIPPFIPPMPSSASASSTGQSDQTQPEPEQSHGHKSHGGGKAAKAAHHGGQRLQQKLVSQMQTGHQPAPAPRNTQAQTLQKQTAIHVGRDGRTGGASASLADGLHAAIRAQDKAGFDALIAAGAAIGLRDANGDTPLALALRLLDSARREAPEAAGLAAYFVAVLEEKGARHD